MAGEEPSQGRARRRIVRVGAWGAGLLAGLSALSLAVRIFCMDASQRLVRMTLPHGEPRSEPMFMPRSWLLWRVSTRPRLWYAIECAAWPVTQLERGLRSHPLPDEDLRARRLRGAASRGAEEGWRELILFDGSPILYAVNEHAQIQRVSLQTSTDAP